MQYAVSTLPCILPGTHAERLRAVRQVQLIMEVPACTQELANVLAMADVISMPEPRLSRQALTASWLARQLPEAARVLQPMLDR